jgi:hypothetical protein
MATAQVLKATHTVDDRVAGVGDRLAHVNERVIGIDERVAGVDDCVKAIDDKVAVVIDGARPSLISPQENILNSDVPRWKRDKASHTTSRRRHGSSETLVIFFLR